MTLFGLMTLLVGFTGGGLIATVTSHYFQSRAARKSFEREHLESALRHLYGPLVRIFRDAEMLLERYAEIHKTYSEYFKKPWAESARERVGRQRDAVLEVANEYIQKIYAILDEAVNAMSVSWHLVDVADMDVLMEVRRSRAIMDVEWRDPNRERIPAGFQATLGFPPFYNHEWLCRIEASYQSKMDRYRALAGAKGGRGKER